MSQRQVNANGIVRVGQLDRKTGTLKDLKHWLIARQHLGRKFRNALFPSNELIEDLACTEAVASVCANETLEAAAIILFERPWIEALAVMHNDEVVGIVSRHNVLRSLASLTYQAWPGKAALQVKASGAAG